MTVEYELPLGWLGDVADSLVMKREIRSLFRCRQMRLTKLLAQG